MSEQANWRRGYYLYRQTGINGDFTRASEEPRPSGESILSAADWYMREHGISDGEVFGLGYSEGRSMRLFRRQVKTIVEEVRP